MNASSDTSRACFSDILGELCLSRGIAGVIIEGGTRDVQARPRNDWFCRGMRQRRLQPWRRRIRRERRQGPCRHNGPPAAVCA
ncbi:hypothetical protein [Arthrobacter crystallopoietes]|uniref:RraA family protein n=1 Tax=Crystallibacter crystallopoietes TaxID=37928 RepID=UPI003D1C48EE